MIIGIDIDDTITCTKETVNKYLQKEYPDLAKGQKPSRPEYIRFLKRNMKQMRAEQQLKVGVKEAFAYFQEQNYKIIIITARNNKYYRDSKKDTLKFLKENGILYDKIYFNDPKKGRRAKKEHIDIFIDDKETVLDNVAKYNITCLCMGTSSRYPVFANWLEIIDYMKKGG